MMVAIRTATRRAMSSCASTTTVRMRSRSETDEIMCGFRGGSCTGINPGLTSNVNNGHIHGPSLATATAGTTINFNTLPGATFSFGQTAGTAHGTVVLNAATQITATINGDSLQKLLFAGLTYANIHTVNN